MAQVCGWAFYGANSDLAPAGAFIYKAVRDDDSVEGHARSAKGKLLRCLLLTAFVLPEGLVCGPA